MAAIAVFTTDAVHFKCIFGIEYVITRVYSCKPTVNLTESTSLEEVTGNHMYNSDNDLVEYLHVSGQILPFIPQGIETFFKNLKAMTYFNTSMLSISAEDLRPFPKLESLSFDRNKLTSLDGDLFSNNPKLSILQLRHNRIQHIGHDLLSPLSNLKYFYLDGNICTERYAVTRNEVIELAPQLSVLCPPLDVTTTENPIEQCTCDDEIDNLREEIMQQSSEIKLLQESNDQLIRKNEMLLELNAAIEERLQKVEIKLQEIS